MTRRAYPSDLTDAQWARLAPLLPAAKPGGHPRTVDLREVVNAILYVLREGCRWRALPHDFPPWSTAYGYFWHWRRDGTWLRVHDALREQVRVALGRAPTPSAGSLDSQSVKTTEKGGRGYDAGKHVAGRKRHIAVDTEGLLLRVVVHSAGIQDRDGGKIVVATLMEPAVFPRLAHLWVDGAYGGLVEFAARYAGLTVQVVSRPAGTKGFLLLPRRWVVERTFAWLGNCRRLSQDYEALPETEEALIYLYLAMAALMLHRLAPEPKD